MAESLIKVFHVDKSVPGLEKNVRWLLIHFGIHFCMSISCQLILRTTFVKNKRYFMTKNCCLISDTTFNLF